jgi:hypothetical protein
MKRPPKLTRKDKIALGKKPKPFKAAKVADGALQAQLAQAGFTVVGRPLSELGLENNVVILKDGSHSKLQGFVLKEGQTVEEAVRLALPEGATLYVPAPEEVEQKPQGRPQRDYFGKKETKA